MMYEIKETVSVVYAYTRMCGISEQTYNSPYYILHQSLDQFKDFCTFDACVADDPDRSICSSFEIFAAVCEEYNGDTKGWIEATGCGKSLCLFACLSVCLSCLSLNNGSLSVSQVNSGI